MPSTSVWLAGDESGSATLGEELGRLDPEVTVVVTIEVASMDEVPELPAHPKSIVRWLVRAIGDAPGAELVRALGTDVLPDDVRIWVACDPSVAPSIRRVLLDRGMAPERLAIHPSEELETT